MRRVSMLRGLCVVAVVIACGGLQAAPARAHPLSPASLLIREHAAQRYQVRFRRSQLAAPVLSLDLPGTCRRGAIEVERDGDQLVDRFTLDCSRSLEGQTLRVFGLVELSLGALVHVEFESGESVRTLLTPERASLRIPARSSRWSVLSDYVRLGVEHLLTGLDHLLFVCGLLLLVQGTRRLIATLTAFTLGHSVTLCLAALSLLRLPQAPVEVGIAVSLIALAMALLSPAEHVARPWGMALAFGLLHGLGFAGALAETGLPQHAIPLSLLGFNLGVELAQLGVVAAALPLLYALSKWPASRSQRLRGVVGYAIGSLAAMWCIERTLDWRVWERF